MYRTIYNIFTFLVLSIGLTSVYASAGFAQETGAPETGAPESGAPVDHKSQFDAAFAKYKEFVREFEERRNKYQAADESDREQINSDLGNLVASASLLMDEMIHHGIEAYKLSPGKNGELGKFLESVARYNVVGRAMNKSGTMRDGGDHYERALPIIETLAEGGEYKDPMLPVWGLVASFATADFDRAEHFATMAEEKEAMRNPDSVSDPVERSLMMTALNDLAAIGSYRKLWAKEQEIRAAEAEADDLPRVKFTTNKGVIVLELFENEAPIAVANFVTLVKKGYYDGLTFHRVLSGFMAQGGCPTGTGSGGPGYNIKCECYEPNARKHFRGSLSMAHAGRNTGGSQFFLTFVPTGGLDGRHTVFGRVIEGMEVSGEIQRRDPEEKSQLPKPDRIIKAEVLRDRGHGYEFPKQ